jgi:hypothetical protein
MPGIFGAIRAQRMKWLLTTMLPVLLICYGDDSICRKSTRPKFNEIQEKQRGQ